MNGINEWMMQANEQQCLNELLAQPDEEAALTLTGGAGPSAAGNPAGDPAPGGPCGMGRGNSAAAGKAV